MVSLYRPSSTYALTTVRKNRPVMVSNERNVGNQCAYTAVQDVLPCATTTNLLTLVKTLSLNRPTETPPCHDLSLFADTTLRSESPAGSDQRIKNTSALLAIISHFGARSAYPSNNKKGRGPHFVIYVSSESSLDTKRRTMALTGIQVLLGRNGFRIYDRADSSISRKERFGELGCRD